MKIEARHTERAAAWLKPRTPVEEPANITTIKIYSLAEEFAKAEEDGRRAALERHGNNHEGT